MRIELNAYALALKQAQEALEEGDKQEASDLIGMVIDDIEDALDKMETDELVKLASILEDADEAFTLH